MQRHSQGSYHQFLGGNKVYGAVRGFWPILLGKLRLLGISWELSNNMQKALTNMNQLLEFYKLDFIFQNSSFEGSRLATVNSYAQSSLDHSPSVFAIMQVCMQYTCKYMLQNLHAIVERKYIANAALGSGRNFSNLNLN